jgi:hypothetical protein
VGQSIAQSGTKKARWLENQRAFHVGDASLLGAENEGDQNELDAHCDGKARGTNNIYHVKFPSLALKQLIPFR